MALALFSTPVYAEWSSTASSNLAIGYGSGDQVQPKIVRTPDGGAWISWFDNGGAGGYSVRLQRVDSVGNPMLGPNGILVATRGFSSTTDYSLNVDAQGDALLAFRTDQYGGTKIEAQVVAPNGTLVWGPDGREFANGSDFVANPKISPTSDGDIVVGWTDNANMQFAKLDAQGNELWNPEVVISDPNGASLTLSDMHESTSGSTILSYVDSASFSSPKYLYALKLDSQGNTSWTTPVYTGGSLQFGNYPAFVPDGSGGGVFAWYDSGNLQSHVQHILSDGSEVFPQDGVLVSTNSSDVQVYPSVAYDPTTQDIFVFWTEQDSLQSESGVNGQRIDASGNLMWGSGGITILPKQTNGSYLESTVATSDDGAIVFYAGGTSFGADQIYAARLDTAGNYVWNPGIVDVSSTPAQKFRMSAITTTTGMPIATWEDTGTGDSNILAQNVNLDGTLGPTCPQSYTVSSGSVQPGARVTAATYHAAAGTENAILLGPAGVHLFGAFYNPSLGYHVYPAGSTNEIHHLAPKGWFRWVVTADGASQGGNFQLCIQHP